MNLLDLFAGGGGFSLAAKDLGIEVAQFVEKEKSCQRVLSRRFPGIPIHSDVQDYEPEIAFDIITAGYPCTDISPASHTRTGLEGDRSGLFYEVIRIIRAIRPNYVILENSSALLTHRGGRDMRSILWELSHLGYDAQWSVVSACSVGAPHMRKRLFIVAYPNTVNVEGVAFQQKFNRSLQEINSRPRPKLWAGEPPASRMADGLSRRMERMQLMGNAVVPEVARVPLAIANAMEEARRAVQS